MLRKALILVLIFVLSSLAVSAQLDEDANACAEGGSMEGKCNVDFNGDGEINDYEVTWAWTCGWYIIRYDAGIFSRAQVPVFCSSLLPSEPVDEGSGDDDGTDYCAYAYDDGTFRIFFFDGSKWDTGRLSDSNEGHRPCGDGDDIPL